MRIGIIGAGSWGTALAKLFREKGHDVTLLARSPKVCDEINAKLTNSRYLPGIRLPQGIKATTAVEEFAEGSEVFVWAVPCQALRGVAGGLRSFLRDGVPLVSSIKGIEVETGRIPTEILKEVFPRSPVLVLSGPSFALEVAKGLPTAVVLASTHSALAEELQREFSTANFRVYRSEDVVGVEVCGALKNVIAIASGICDGLKLGLNARAALITRGLTELMRFGVKLGASSLTFSGLAGLGDLVLTCTGRLSRNYTVGYRVAQGESLEEVLKDLGQVAEGVETVKAVRRLSRSLSVEMPISEGVYEILFEDKSPLEVLKRLLSRPLKAEF